MSRTSSSDSDLARPSQGRTLLIAFVIVEALAILAAVTLVLVRR